MGGKLVVDLGDGVELGLDLFSVEGVQEDLHVLLSIEGHSGGLSNNRSGEALFNIKFD